MKKKKKRNPLNRYTFLKCIAIGILSALALRLVDLQVFHYQEYKEKVANSSFREIPDPAPRGNIVDKNGLIFAKSNQSYVLVYNETQESRKQFFQTMDKVFALLSKNGEIQQDDFELKVPDAKDSNYRFEFRSDDPAVKRALEIRFKRDRGLNEDIEKQLFPGKKEKLTDAEIQQVNDRLMKITPEETFKKLVELYKIDDTKKPKYSVEQERKYMLVRDDIKMNSFTGYKPVIMASNIKKDTAFIFLQRLNDLPGVDVTNQPTREYPFGDLGSSFLGYISKINDVDKDKYEERGYDVSSDFIGTAGIESVFEDRLKGSKGGRIVKLNSSGRVVEELGRRDPYPGQNIQLTIDKNVQYAAEKAMDQVMNGLRNDPNRQDVYTANATRGTVVVEDVNTGGIIALVSKPGYDPNLFSAPGGLTSDQYNQYFNPDLKSFGVDYVVKNGLARNFNGKTVDQIVDEVLFPVDKSTKGSTARRDVYDIYPKPFLNYATSALIPPGSTFKPLTAIAALEEGVIGSDTLIEDKGVYTKNNFNGANLEWTQSHYTFGWVNMLKAIEASINYYFFELGDRLIYESGNLTAGYDNLAKYAWKFGLGVDPKSKGKITTGIEIPENFGQVANLYSTKVRFSREYYSNTVDLVKANKGINIGVDGNDSDSIKKIKSSMKDLIIQQMQENKNNNAFSSKLVELLKQLAAEAPELKDKKLTSSDINAVAQQINRKVYDCNGEIYNPGVIYSASIGQGMDQFTPLQMVNYVSTIVNGGNRYKLHLLDKITDADGNVVKKEEPQVYEKVSMKPETVDIVKRGMLAVTSGAEGTASGAFQNLPIKTAGKTGSATFQTNQQLFGRTSYANYLGFAPYDKPQIAVFVSIFDGGYGTYAAPVAKAVYEAYFKDEINKLNPGYTSEFDFMKQFFPQSAQNTNATTGTTH